LKEEEVSDRLKERWTLLLSSLLILALDVKVQRPWSGLVACWTFNSQTEDYL